MGATESTDLAILREMGRRLRRERLNADLTREQLAERAGVSVKTLQKVEAGRNASMQTWLGILRGLGQLDRIEAFLPPPGISPVQLAKLQGKRRQRASGSGGESPPPPAGEWSW